MQTFIVKLNTKGRVKVEADYYRIDNGLLVFRMNRVGNGYPLTVHAFAAGQWQHVKTEPEKA